MANERRGVGPRERTAVTGRSRGSYRSIFVYGRPICGLRWTATWPVERRISRGVGSSIDWSRTIDQSAATVVWVACAWVMFDVRQLVVVVGGVSHNHITYIAGERQCTEYYRSYALASNLIYFIPRSHSYCLSLSLCLERYNGSMTPRVHSGVTKRIQCRLHYRPLNKCVKPLSGV